GKPCLLAVGVWVPATGFTRVLSSIFTRLADRYDTHVIGIGYKGPEMLVEGVNVHPCNLKGGDMFGQYQAELFVRQHGPEVVFLLNDLWVLDKYVPHLAPYQDNTRIVCYAPLDGRLLDETLLAPFSGLAPRNRFAVYTEFARRELQQATSRLAQSQEGFTFPPVIVMPHGVDTETFYPLAGSVERQLQREGRLAAKQMLFPGAPDLEDSFVVLNANRAQSRKRIDLTLQGFALFARDKPQNVKLVLHHAVPYGDALAQVWRQAEALGIADRVRLGPEAESGVTNEELNLVYNACDVGVNTSMGEGWGLVSFEHAATGAAQIVPRHSACAELWAESAEMVETVAAYVPDFGLLEMQEVAPEGVAAALERLYADEAHRRDLSLRAYRNATQPAYRWDHIAQQWSRLFNQVGADHRTGPA
ncbi:MAG: glycosyltransferase family 4 protein, partial [Chloroflexota bacterium]|nr:glycosyltransferase family 4 protein [Chloroflexota bacterium]MDQ5866388.1 glycosyltransferase family 4 protein [Chloroflexota bacterium]